MPRSPAQVLSVKRKALAVLATLTLAVLSAAAPGGASAATPECGERCLSVFSSELGAYGEPNFVEAILGGGGAHLGQPVGLGPANKLDPTLDITPVGNTVEGFHELGLASDAANREYGKLFAVQQKYAPYGLTTKPELCVGLARVVQNEGLTLQPCTSPTTVWIPYFPLETESKFVPIINAATTDFNRPFAMHLPRNEVAAGRPLQMQTRRLQFRTDDKTLPARQLWGFHPGVLP